MQKFGSMSIVSGIYMWIFIGTSIEITIVAYVWFVDTLSVILILYVYCYSNVLYPEL